MLDLSSLANLPQSLCRETLGKSQENAKETLRHENGEE